MTEEQKIQVEEEIAILKQRADLMGIAYHPSISLDKLKARINAKLNDEPLPLETNEEEATVTTITERTLQFKPETKVEKMERLRLEAARLVRIRVTCMNPNKKDWDGDVFTVSNSFVGTFRKYVPFNAEEGWHVPNIIYEYIKDKNFVHHYVEKKDGKEINRHKLVKEFAVEVLDPLTDEELKELAQRQAMSRSIED
jgi:hypothetical protein